MKTFPLFRRVLLSRSLLSVVVFAGCAVAGFGSTVLYQTHFEQSEGYDPMYTLAGQRGWDKEGSGGNGLTEAWVDYGQQAYIGFLAPTNSEEFTSLFRPIDFQPVPASRGIVKFSTLMQIAPSTNGHDDDFRWSVYNNANPSKRLFSLDFEGTAEPSGLISAILEDGSLTNRNLLFSYDGFYELAIWIDFGRNLWAATLNDIYVINSQPITLSNAEMSLGDIDAVWSIRTPGSAGDNYMIFDDYTVTSEDVIAIPAGLEALGLDPQSGAFKFTVLGEEGVNYSIEVTSDFEHWFSLGTFDAPSGGQFVFEDTTSSGFAHGFYRVRALN